MTASERYAELIKLTDTDRKSWFGWFGTQMGAEWKEMDKDDKEPFEALAEKDKARYEREMANYTPPPPPEDSDSDDE